MTIKGGPRCGKQIRSLATKLRPVADPDGIAYCGKPETHKGVCRSEAGYQHDLARNRAYYAAGRRRDRNVKPIPARQ